jgi:hypothetical protein
VPGFFSPVFSLRLSSAVQKNAAIHSGLARCCELDIGRPMNSQHIAIVKKRTGMRGAVAPAATLKT